MFADFRNLIFCCCMSCQSFSMKLKLLLLLFVWPTFHEFTFYSATAVWPDWAIFLNVLVTNLYSITWSPCQQASQPVFTSFILQLFKIGLQGNQTNRTSIKKLHKHLHLIGQWCGSVDRAAASDTKDLKFECSHRENLYSAFVFCHTYCKLQTWK